VGICGSGFVHTYPSGRIPTGQQGERRHDDGDGKHEDGNDGKGQQFDTPHDDGNGRHDFGYWRHDDGRHNNGKGQKEAAAPPPAAYQRQYHCENSQKTWTYIYLSTVFEI
jgi:hypothetical protein